MRVIICENDGAMFRTPAVTAFDAISSFLSAAVYVIVAVAALAESPRDPRARAFLAVALAGLAPYGITAVIWERGPEIATTKGAIVLVALSLMLGSLLLFHFTQLFPWRRPWIHRHAQWLWSGYIGIVSLVGAAAVVTPSFDALDTSMLGASAPGSGGIGAVSPELVVGALGLLAVMIPVLLLLGVVVPLAGLTSLYRSWRLARARGLDAARRTTMWMLVSQMAGGVLTILIIPLLRVVAPRGPWVTMAAALLFAFGLLMPLAFALAVWRYRMLDTPVDALPQ
jgi:hypothetical protein